MRKAAIPSNQRGAAAAEMVLVLPMVLTLMAGLFEMGHFFYSEQRLVEAVRDSARYAARQAQSDYSACSDLVSGNAIYDNAQTLARKGVLDSSADDLLWGWSQAGASFSVSVICTANAVELDGNGNTVSSTAMGGIYRDNAVGAPIVTVSATVPHPTVFGYIGVPLGLNLNASSQSAVMGV